MSNKEFVLKLLKEKNNILKSQDLKNNNYSKLYDYAEKLNIKEKIVKYMEGL